MLNVNASQKDDDAAGANGIFIFELTACSPNIGPSSSKGKISAKTRGKRVAKYSDEENSEDEGEGDRPPTPVQSNSKPANASNANPRPKKKKKPTGDD